MPNPIFTKMVDVSVFKYIDKHSTTEFVFSFANYALYALLKKFFLPSKY